MMISSFKEFVVQGCLALMVVLVGGDFVAHSPGTTKQTPYQTAYQSAVHFKLPLVVGVRCDPPKGDWVGVRVEEWTNWGRQDAAFLIVSKVGKGQMDWVADLAAGATSREVSQTLGLPQKGGKSRLTLLDAWGSWCGPCRASLPALNAVFDRFSNRLRFQGIASEPDQATLDAAVKRLGVRMPQRLLRDDDRRKFNIQAYPTLILIDEDGTVLWRHEGVVDQGTLEAVLNRHLEK